jgi:uncharacterized DUF497 family protein
MRFEWGERKNKSNFKKHKIWFEEAQTIWADVKSAEFLDPEHSEDENRFIRIGFSMSNRILIVAFCERDEESTVRLISARKATPKEVKQYEKGI